MVPPPNPKKKKKKKTLLRWSSKWQAQEKERGRQAPK